MSENKTNNLNNTCARYEFISFENTQRITDPSEASNKIFFCRKTSNFNGSCNVTLHLWCDNNIYINGVCSYVSRWNNYRWQHLILIGSRQFSALFTKGGHLRTPTQVSEDLKTPIKNWAILFFKHAEILDVKWDSNPISSRLCTWGIVKSDRRNVLEDFSNYWKLPPRQHVTRD